MPAATLEALESEEKQLSEENKIISGEVKAYTQGSSSLRTPEEDVVIYMLSRACTAEEYSHKRGTGWVAA